MIDAQQIKSARFRLWRAWFFGGLLWSFFFLLLAAGIVLAFGVEKTNATFSVVLAAAILAGGTYGIILLTALVVHMIRRIVAGKPIVDKE